MLRLDLTEIIRTPGMYQTYEINEPPYTDDDIEYVSPITGRLTITNTGTMLLVRGPIHTTISQECSRCLEPVRSMIETTLEEEFDLKAVEGASHHDGDVQVVEEEMGKVFDGPVLQVDVLIYQAAVLNAPLQPLCRETCPGIPIQPSQAQSENQFETSPFRDLSKLLNN